MCLRCLLIKIHDSNLYINSEISNENCNNIWNVQLLLNNKEQFLEYISTFEYNTPVSILDLFKDRIITKNEIQYLYLPEMIECVVLLLLYFHDSKNAYYLTVIYLNILNQVKKYIDIESLLILVNGEFSEYSKFHIHLMNDIEKNGQKMVGNKRQIPEEWYQQIQHYNILCKN
jgi:hypothetical protein